MSILIPGKMPKQKSIFIEITPHGGVNEIINPLLSVQIGLATELPPHGRLIDADALRRQWIEVESENGGEMRLDELTLHDIITEGCVFDLDNAPTIIPAEGGIK